MKNFTLLVGAICFAFLSFAQSPNSFNFQAVVRYSSGEIAQDQNVKFRISILEGSETGTIVFQEVHTAQTNAFGLVNLPIGDGTAVTGDLKTVKWGENIFFIKVEMDIDGGNSYTHMATQQLLSVPYALYAGSVANSDNDETNEIQEISVSNDTIYLSKGGGFGIISVGKDTGSVTNLIKDKDGDTRIEVEQYPDVDEITFSLSGTQYFQMKDGYIHVTNTGGSVFLGEFAGSSDDQKDGYNVAIGQLALPVAENSSYNTAVGALALSKNTTSGNGNTAIGSNSMVFNTSGSSNVALGKTSLYANQTGVRNVAVGANSMINNISGKDNIGVGFNSLYRHKTGSYNIAIGDETMFNSNKGYNNIAIGFGTLYNDTAGAQNIALGSQAMYYSSYSQYNVALGYRSMYGSVNAASGHNVAIGSQTMYNITTGSKNVALGYLAMNEITRGDYNIAIGARSLNKATRAIHNVALGYKALGSDTSGNFNIAIGHEPLKENIIGNNNIALGFRSLEKNISGAFNIGIGYLALNGSSQTDNLIAIGHSALSSVTTGVSNIAIGYGSFRSLTTGKYGTAIGNNAAGNATTGIYVTAVGSGTLSSLTVGAFNTGVGSGALKNDTSGGFNTALGVAAGSKITSESYNTFVGYNSGATTTYSNTTALGYSSTNTADDQVRIGNTAVKSIGGYASWTNLSDARFKDNVQEDVVGLDFIMKLRPVTYTVDVRSLNSFLGVDTIWNNEGDEGPSENLFIIERIEKSSQIVHTGFIAQEVENAADSVGFNFSGIDKPQNENDHYGLRYAEFVVPLVKGMQEQQEQIQALQQQVVSQQEQILEMQKLIVQLMEEQQ